MHLEGNQTLADLLTLGALGCRAAAACLAVRSESGWATLPFGLPEDEDLAAGELFEAVADSMRPMQFSDLTSVLAGSPLVEPPLDLRWAFGINLRDRTGEPIGIVVVFDRVLHEITGAEERALAAMGRRMVIEMTGRTGLGNPPSAAQAPAQVPSLDRRGVTPRLQARDVMGGQLLKTGDVAAQFDVTERTVINWVNAGRLPALRTVGGHLRFRKADVLALIAGAQRPDPRQ